MRDYKLLFIGLIILLLIIFVVVFTWLWTSNRKNIDPLPILAGDIETVSSSADDIKIREDQTDFTDADTLYIRADDKLQLPLDDVITNFETRYPNLQVLTHYVAANKLLQLTEISQNNDHTSPFISDTDLIITKERLTEDLLSPLQDQLNQKSLNKNTVIKNSNTVSNNEVVIEGIDEQIVEKGNQNPRNDKITSDNQEARNIISFSYALKDKTTADGVIITDNPLAVNFRNYMLSSTGQDILKKYDYQNIDGYQNTMDDLFNPSSRAQAYDSSVDVKDALSNGE